MLAEIRSHNLVAQQTLALATSWMLSLAGEDKEDRVLVLAPAKMHSLVLNLIYKKLVLVAIVSSLLIPPCAAQSAVELALQMVANHKHVEFVRDAGRFNKSLVALLEM
jgi:hypothetical protein